MATINLTAQQTKQLTGAGINIQWLTQLLQSLGKYGGPFLQLILALLGDLNPPTPTPPAPSPTPVQALADACPCPAPGDGPGCCHAAQHHILLAALCCEGHCGKGSGCDTKCCCQETLRHLMKAVECCACHACA